MNIQRTMPRQAQAQAEKPGWFHNKERKPGVISSSPAENVRDAVSFTTTMGVVGGVTAAVVRSMAPGVLGTIALTAGSVAAGAVAGSLGTLATQQAVGAALGVKDDGDIGGGVAGLVYGGIVGGASALAASLGADPTTVGLTAAGASGGLGVLAALSIPG